MKKDHVLKDFFSYPVRFADFMNALFFDGHAIIHPCDLHPLDSREIFIGDFLSKERTHDASDERRIVSWRRKMECRDIIAGKSQRTRGNQEKTE